MLFSRIFSFFVLCTCGEAVNLRNGQKSLGISLHEESFASGSKGNRKLQTNFDWELNLEDEWPQILFDATADDGEVQFKYNYTGTTVTNTKWIEFELRRGDCMTAASSDAVLLRNFVDDAAAGEITFDVDVLQATVTGTPEYVEAPDGLSADIVFCVRGDYFYGNAQGFRESVNFHETNVTITADLTANFTLTAVNVDRVAADQAEEEIQIDCSVKAYFCDGDYNDLGQPTFTQGDIMSVCVEIADEDVGRYHLDDVIAMDLNQDKNDGTVDDAQVIINRFPSPVSSKICQNGICLMRHLIQSKFFDERNPKNLDLAGIALCGFGPVPRFTDRKRRTVTEAFTNAAIELGTSGEEPTTLELCEAECLRVSCKAMVVNDLGNEGFVGCTYYDTQPATEQTQASDTAHLYLYNSEGVVDPASIPGTALEVPPEGVPAPSVARTVAPSISPTDNTRSSTSPTAAHSIVPTDARSAVPSPAPSAAASTPPTAAPSIAPTDKLSAVPSLAPSAAASTSPSSASTGTSLFVNFDDLSPGSSSQIISDGYQTLNWNNIAVMNPSAGFNVNSGFHNGVVSRPVVAFNSLGNEGTIERSEPGQKITLQSLHATAAWVNGLQLTVEGYRNGAVVATSVTALSNQYPTQVDFDGTFQNLDKFTFLGTTTGSGSTVVVLEDLSLTIK